MPATYDTSHLDAAERELVVESTANPEVFRAVALTKIIAQEKHCSAQVQDFKADHREVFKRVASLERWKAWALGGLAAIAGVGGFITFLVWLVKLLTTKEG